jgi:hypothetical protein
MVDFECWVRHWTETCLVRKLLAACCVLVLGVGLAHLGVAGPEPCANQNGDNNGDGARDLSDAVYLLTFLFQGGPAPVAICPDLGGPETNCNDGVDNDEDGDADCSDADCQTESFPVTDGGFEAGDLESEPLGEVPHDAWIVDETDPTEDVNSAFVACCSEPL